MTLAERIEKFNNLMGDIVPPEVKRPAEATFSEQL